ncbi:MAG: prolipoprotein diacylglyceryl transferase [Ignavibacteria bacterium]|nr:prolipoprotein diacylglyceryl transferase [Ignavibacteria bacterium]
MITWNVDPEIFSLGPLSIRYYGVLFAVAFLAGFKIMSYIFKNEGKSENDLNDLFLYMFFGTVIGARLGHVLFYDPVNYLSNPLKILEVWKGGLASHGAAIGILAAIYFYCQKHKDQSFLWVLDRIVITVALGGCFVRLGNLFNSEIIGTYTNIPWGFIFVNAMPPETEPRHPAQLYEALSYLVLFFVLIGIYRKKWREMKEGFIFGIFLIYLFTARFLIEFVKDVQEAFEQDMILKMGQILSIPFILLGIYILFFYKKKQSAKNYSSKKNIKNNAL